MRKTVKIEITVLILAFIALGVYYIPGFNQKQEVMKAAKIKADNTVFTQKALDKFANEKNIKASIVAQTVMDELNQTAQNPYDKNTKPYTFEKECKGCNSIETDDALEMIILTTYDKKGDLIGRTVIKPPSFVTYSSKEEK